MAIAAGPDVKVVQRMLGHADATMTLNTYADLWPDRLDDVSNAMTLQRSLALGRSDHQDDPRRPSDRSSHDRVTTLASKQKGQARETRA